MSAPRMIEGKCLAPQDPRPNITTSFCVYAKGHKGDHSWEHTPAARAKRLAAERGAA